CVWPGGWRDRWCGRRTCLAPWRDRRHRDDLGALRRGHNSVTRRGRVWGLAGQESVQGLFDRAESGLTCKECREGLGAEHRLDGGELVGIVAHPDAIATFDRVLAGAQHDRARYPRMCGRL